jgi:hypothetical protein
MSIPAQGWSLLRLDPPHGVIVHVGGEQLRVVVNGRWEPPEPERYTYTSEPPTPQPRESHQDYAWRFLAWANKSEESHEWLKWRPRKVWIGQTLDELRDLIESDQSIDNECFLVNQQQIKPT